MVWIRRFVGFMALSLCAACGSQGFDAAFSDPPPPEAATTPAPADVGSFEKVAHGFWKTACLPFTENAKSFSLLRALELTETQAKTEARVFTGSACQGTPLNSERFTLKADASEFRASGSTLLAQLEFTYPDPREFATAREIYEASVTGKTLQLHLKRMSFWEQGTETWIPEEDLEALPSDEYHRP